MCVRGYDSSKEGHVLGQRRRDTHSLRSQGNNSDGSEL